MELWALAWVCHERENILAMLERVLSNVFLQHGRTGVVGHVD